MHSALRFGFQASNNEAEYEALIVGLHSAKEMKVKSLEIYSDSQLALCQITNEYQARGEKMEAYLQKAKDLLSTFSSFTIRQVPREHNTQVDALARLASTKNAELLEVILVEFLSTPSIRSMESQLTVSCITSADTWILPSSGTLKKVIYQRIRNKHGCLD